jgi:hypothetical protein
LSFRLLIIPNFITGYPKDIQRLNQLIDTEPGSTVQVIP